MQTLDNTIEVKAGDFPLYVNNPINEPEEKEEPKPIDSTLIQQGPGSQLNADKCDGLHAVTAAQPGPNVLVATADSGMLPIKITHPYSFWLNFGGF